MAPKNYVPDSWKLIVVQQEELFSGALFSKRKRSTLAVDGTLKIPYPVQKGGQIMSHPPITKLQLVEQYHGVCPVRDHYPVSQNECAVLSTSKKNIPACLLCSSPFKSKRARKPSGDRTKEVEPR